MLICYVAQKMLMMRQLECCSAVNVCDKCSEQEVHNAVRHSNHEKNLHV